MTTNLNADAWGLLQEIDAVMAKAAREYGRVRGERERRYRAFGLDPAVRYVRDDAGEVSEAPVLRVAEEAAGGS